MDPAEKDRLMKKGTDLVFELLNIKTEVKKKQKMLKKYGISLRDFMEDYRLVEVKEEAVEEKIEIPNSVSIHTDVCLLNFQKVTDNHGPFDVIMMDPPWKLTAKDSTRGVNLEYTQMDITDIGNMEIPLLQEKGFIFVWVITSTYVTAINLMKRWGYKLVDELVWIKKAHSGGLAKSHGYYLQHAKETCLVGWKGGDLPVIGQASDLILAIRGGQSEKPLEIYDIIEKACPGGKYVEIFGRKRNLRSGWVTIGNEL
ncbi:MAG: MT-A70 family protein [Amphiamblys sp. WSBS2006]|nr:MAG: MT-A70 family protein [Amphiamblys sp. WSBS2006]